MSAAPDLKLPEETPAAYLVVREPNPRATKIIQFLDRAIHRHGTRHFTRDLSEPVWLNQTLRGVNALDDADLGAMLHSSKHEQLCLMGLVHPVISCDAHWLIPEEHFTTAKNITHIFSLWPGGLDDFIYTSRQVHLKSSTVLEKLNHERLRHLFFDPTILEDARALGFQNAELMTPSIPEEFVSVPVPTTTTTTVALNPLSAPPTPSSHVLSLLKERDPIARLRQLAAEEILESFAQTHPTLSEQVGEKMLEPILARQLEQPFTTALALSPAFLAPPERLEFAALLRSVFRYDVPAIACHLHQAELVTVVGFKEAWAPYGIKAQPRPRIRELASFYQYYPAHLFLPDFITGSTLGEHPFECAGCGRVPIAALFPGTSTELLQKAIPTAQDLTGLTPESLAESLRKVLANPDLPALGLEARQAIMAAHTWRHRLPLFLQERA